MDPVDHPRCNFTFLGPTPDIGDLRVELVPDEDDESVDHVASFWKPTAGEIAALNAGGLVRLGVWAMPIPPLSLSVEAAEPTRSATAVDVIVKGQAHTINDSPPPVDATDLLNVALATAGWEGGAWEIRDTEGVPLAPNERLAGHPQPFYIDPPAGVGG